MLKNIRSKEERATRKKKLLLVEIPEYQRIMPSSFF
jgi:hypothetical protein